MSLQLEKLKDAINDRIFTIPILEVVSGEGETTRIKLAEQYRDNEFLIKHSFDDLFILDSRTKLFSDRFKKFAQEIADDQGIKINIIYSQCIIEART